MRDLQATIIDELGVQPSIDPAQEVARRVGFLKDYLKATGTKGYVLGISGGGDSTLSGKPPPPAVDELKAEGVEATFVAVRLPYGVQHDEEDAQAAMDFIKPTSSWTFNIKSAVDGFQSEFTATTGEAITDFNKGNIKARARMMA